MRLDRYTIGTCRYIVIDVRKLFRRATGPLDFVAVLTASTNSEINAAVQLGQVGSDDEFLVLKLKDRNTAAALRAYAAEAEKTDPELAADIRDMAERSENHPNRKRPD